MKIETAIEWAGTITVAVIFTLLLGFILTVLVEAMGLWYVIGIVTLISAPLWLGVIIWIIANWNNEDEQ
jgi:hypothetical protein